MHDDTDLMEAYVPVDEAPDDVDDKVEEEYETAVLCLCRVIVVTFQVAVCPKLTKYFPPDIFFLFCIFFSPCLVSREPRPTDQSLSSPGEPGPVLLATARLGTFLPRNL